MSEQGRRSGFGPVLLVIVGALLIVAGTAKLADNYQADYDCIYQLRCHNDGGRSPTATDRLTAALGFGLTQADADAYPLPEPWGTMLVVGGVAALVGALVLSPRRNSSIPPD